MYKKITHTIVEEHFGHPLAPEIKHTLESGFGNSRPMYAIITADKLRNDVSAYFTKLHQRVSGIATHTESGNMDSLLAEETAFFDEVDDLGKMFLPYYGIEFSERITQILRSIGLSMTGIARNLKFKSDIKLLVDRLNGNFDNMDFLLNQFNNNWQLGSVKNIWSQIIESMVNETTAIINKDSNATASATAQLAARLSAFAESFANSVVQQYPNKFIQ
jgi:hypothetical protein